MCRYYLILLLMALFDALPSLGQSSKSGSRIPIELENLSLRSKVLNRDVPYSVILPSDYYSSCRRYPVIYMLHGIGGDHSSWIEYGNVARVMQRLVEEDGMEPAIVVSPDGYQLYYSDTYDGHECYETFFVNELMKTIDNRFRTFPNRGHRFIMGFSMGGFGALTLALRHTDRFSAVAALSASIRSDSVYMSEEPQEDWDCQWGRIFGGVGQKGLNRFTAYYRQRNPKDIFANISLQRLRGMRVMLDIGDKDALMVSNVDMRQVLIRRGIEHKWQVRLGIHDFDCWNAALPKVLRFFLPKTPNDGVVKANMVVRHPAVVKEEKCVLLHPLTNERSNRRYPVVYVKGKNAQEKAEVLAHVADSLSTTMAADADDTTLRFAIRPMIICPLPSSGDIDSAMADMERQCKDIRTGERFRVVVDAADAHDPSVILIEADKKIHR